MKRVLSVLLFISFMALSGQSFAAKKTIGILVFDGVLTSDIIGPSEVFGVATKQAWFTQYDVKLINLHDKKAVTTEEGVTIATDASINDTLDLSVLIVPSAYAMEPLLNNESLINFIRTQAATVDWLASNCSGAYLLAEAGLLNGKKATTWFGGEPDLQKKYPAVLVQDNQNYVVDGTIITSNGSVVSYTAALKLLSLMSSDKLAQEVFDTLQMGRLVTSF